VCSLPEGHAGAHRASDYPNARALSFYDGYFDRHFCDDHSIRRPCSECAREAAADDEYDRRKEERYERDYGDDW